MKNLKITFILIVSLISFINCGGDEDSPIPKERTADDVRVDFQNLNLKAGINDVRLESIVPGLFWDFRVIIPEEASETNKRPLIISLHGGASNDFPEAHMTTGCLIEPGLELLEAIIISPNSNGKFWFEKENQVQVLALVDLANSYLSVDSSKVAITGYSDGGNGSWFYAQFFSNLFSAAIPMASSYNPKNSNGVVEKINIPLYVIHGEDDELFSVETTTDYINLSKEAGTEIEYVIASGLTHYNSCDYVSYLKDAASWLTDVVWK